MCTSPLKAFRIGTTENGKAKLKIVPYAIDHVEFVKGSWLNCDSSFSSPFANKVVREYVEIPCGKCVQCKLNYSRQWADRCMFELEYYKTNEAWFLTLTYDDDHIMDIGSDIFPGTLVKEDLSAFMKRLRRQVDYYGLGDGVRFYACGEYGSKTFRPHYHVILYGLDLIKNDKLEFWNKSKSGFKLWRSPFLEKQWKKGYVIVGQVSWDTCAYTARYVMKKVGGVSSDDYIANGVEPEFVLMSRKPGIGARFFEDHYKEIYENDEVFVKSKDGGRKAKPPKYFDLKYEKLDPERLKEIKDKRKEIAEYTKALKLKHTGLSYTDILEMEDEIIKRKVKLLPRS